MVFQPYRISLAALLLAITWPVLGTHHRLPVITFYQEWAAGMLGLAALLPLVFLRNDGWTIPRTALLPLTLTLLVWVQYATGVDVLFEGAALFSLYLLWAFMLMLATGRLAAGIGREALADWLARALLAGALALAGTGVLQHWVPSIGLPYIFPSPHVSGNIAQRANFADYLWLGVVSALYLHGRGKLACAPLWLMLCALMGLSLLPELRSVHIYALAVTAWCALWARHSEGDSRRRLLFAALLLLPVFWAIQTAMTHQVPRLGILYVGALTAWLALRAWRNAVKPGRRRALAALLSLSVLFALYALWHNIDPLAAGVGQSVARLFDPTRLALWRAALEIFAEHPFLGAGYDSFSREFFLRVERFSIAGYRDPGIPEHSHNLLTEMLAEFGIAGFGLVLAAAIGWLSALRLRDGNGPSQLAFGMLLILGIHSALEYPLWYAHFLAIAAIALSLGDGRGRHVAGAAWHRPMLAAVVIGGMIVLLNLRSDYTLLEKTAYGQTLDGKPLTGEQQRELLMGIYEGSPWRHYAALQLAAGTPIENKDVELRLRMVKSATHFSPIEQAVFRQAALLQLAGQDTEAQKQLRRATVSYPTAIPYALAQMEGSEARAALKPLIDTMRAVR